MPSLSLSAPTPTADGAFQIQVNETRDVAIVTVGPANTNIAQIEAAGAAFTGCDAKAGSFLYGAMNNNRDVGIPRELLRSQFGLVALTLTC